MSFYIVLIFGAHRKAIAVEAFTCETNEEAAAKGCRYADAHHGQGHEVWSNGLKIASSFSREFVRDCGPRH